MLMDHISRAWYGLHIKLALREKHGQAYEDLFCQIMQALYFDQFELVKAAGSDGDGKADGYLIPEKRFFQSYAPDGFEKPKLKKKIKGDFEGAKEKWGNKLEGWTFVHNGWGGLPSYATELLQDLREANPTIEIKAWSPLQILDIALSLPVNKLVDLFGPALTQADLNNLTHEPIKNLLRALGREVSVRGAEIAPVSVSKLQFNDLSEGVEALLSAGRRKEKLVEELLNRWPDPEYGEELAESFRRKYRELKESSQSPDETFMGLKDFAGGNIPNAKSQASALAVLSYLFERCDIFENAPEGWVKDDIAY